MEKLFRSNFKFRIFLFTKLPMGWLAGLRIVQFDSEKCEVGIAFSWWTKNPFRSIYFACLAMAAEMSSGALSYFHVQQSGTSVSMLVTKMEAEFTKKATGKIVFRCHDGMDIQKAITNAIETKQGQQFRSCAIGKDREGNEVARFFITWSYKAKN